MIQNKIKLTEEQKKYMLSILPDYSSSEVVKMMKEKYNVDLVDYKIKHYRQYYGIKCKVHKGQFKKGTMNKHKPVGYEYINSEGYIKIKIEEPNKWVNKQRYVYEKYYGKIPAGCNVVFLDHNKLNCNINNLKLVKNKSLLIAKNMNLLTTNKELTEVGLMVAELIGKKVKLEKGEN